MNISNVQIGINHPPFIIAEMSGNHNQSLEKAIKIVEEAAKAGVTAIKLQTYTADTMTLDLDRDEFTIRDSSSLWDGQSLYQLYKQASTPWEWHEAIFEKAIDLGLIAFSTPFDESSVDFLENLNVPAYKIASFENTDLPLIRKVAATGKPLIISTGMAQISELNEMVKTARDAGCRDLVLLKCTSAYPAVPENANIRTIPHLRELFKCEVGLSDHTMGIGVAVAAVSLGASVIEKHFTLSRAEGGVDSAFSLEPCELKQLSTETKKAWQALGSVNYLPTEKEKKSIVFRRSLYIVQDLDAGTVLTSENLRRIRPGLGVAPKYYDTVLGRKINKSVLKGTPLSWDLLE